MKLKANHLTLLRLLLMPLPCALLFQHGIWERSIALFLIIVIGLTDYWDGYLARKHGPTTLGALLDPLADKIFIAALFIPLAVTHIVPIWMVALMFVREFSITELRSVHGAGGIRFQTSELAKYKTTIQMIGGGVIIGLDIFKSDWTIFIPMGLMVLFALTLAVRSYLRNGRLNARVVTFASLVLLTFALRLIAPYKAIIWLIMAFIVVITLLSGMQYVAKSWEVLGDYLRKNFSAGAWITFLGIGIVFPAVYLAMLYFDGVAVWIIIAILCVEFAVGGLNNLLTTLKENASYVTQSAKTVVIVGAGLIGLSAVFWPDGDRIQVLNILLVAVLIAVIAYCITVVFKNSRFLRKTVDAF